MRKWGDLKMRNRLAVVLNLVEDSTDLKPLTNHRPITTIPFASRYRIIDFMFSSMYNAEISSAAIFISQSGHSLYDHIRSGSVWGLDSSVGGGVFTHSHIDYKLEKSKDNNESNDYYETHRKYIQKSKADHVLVSGASILANVNLDGLIQYHEEKDVNVSAVFKQDARSTLPKETSTNKFKLVGEKFDQVESIVSNNSETESSEQINISLNMVIIKKKFILNFLEYAEDNEIQVNSETLVQYALDIGDQVSAFEYTGYLKSIEDIPSYYQGNLDMLEETHFNSLFFRNNPVITRSHHTPPTYYGPSSVVIQSRVASGCSFYGKADHSIVFRDSYISKGAVVKNSIIMNKTHIGENAKLNYVITDKDVVIENDVQLEGTVEDPIVIKKGQIVTQNSE